MKNYYQTLELSKTASAAEIKRAYRRLALLYHPDRNQHPSAEQVFKEINEAYDVLSDEEKKRNYDFSLLNQYAEIFQQPQGPMHRDPAYRRRKPFNYATRERKPTRLDLIKEYLHYFSWLNWAGVTVMFLLGVDYYSPPFQTKETIEKIYRVETARGGYSRDIVVTNSGRKFRMYSHTAIQYYDERHVYVVYTPIFHTVLEVTGVSSHTSTYVGGIYNPIFFIPCLLFFVSAMGILFRKDPEYNFNFSIGSGMLIFLVVYLIFSA